ncbi:hypothetical protein Pint_31572 [Pistacia integerrima]|uniref:Uncharacterized protein n=1 Tax=Pistacia integerrima TaxID=434235 RepID=A0ACC0XM20_9ROSI|nr:hypothetical protein Pint_31572 [Pistacia integerrima]
MRNLSVFSFSLLMLLHFGEANNQADNLYSLIKSKRSLNNRPLPQIWPQLQATKDYSPSFIVAQDGFMQADKIGALPGQPDGVDFDQYGGYVTVDPQAGRALFYYFVESPQNSSTNPLVLWLNGGPGCSSFGYGAMSELGPFRVNTDGKTLFRNNYAWNNVANVIFLESPAGVGFSYSNTSSDYGRTGDKSSANDAYTFLVNWLERFPQYKNRDFYITGESYAGHYVPQLAYTILLNNENSNQTIIKLKGIAVRNAWIDDATNTKGLIDFLWTHALNSDETNKDFHMYCDFENDTSSSRCDTLIYKALFEMGDIDFYHIYAPICINPTLKNGPIGSVHEFDPCTDYYVESYLSIEEVQTALHAKPTNWSACTSKFNWTDSPTTILPIIKDLMESGTRVWIYSGDVDGRVPITSSRYSINSLNLPIQTVWHPWYINDEVGGYVVEYQGVTLATVRGAGHLAPSYQPERALLMISSFLQGILPPSSP